MERLEEEMDDEEEIGEPENAYTLLGRAMYTVPSPKTFSINLGDHSILSVTKSDKEVIKNLKEVAIYSRQNNDRFMHEIFKDYLNGHKYHREEDGQIMTGEKLVEIKSPIQICNFTLVFNQRPHENIENFELIPTSYEIYNNGMPVLNSITFDSLDMEYKIHINKLIYFSIINALNTIFSKVVPIKLRAGIAYVNFSVDYYPHRQTNTDLGTNTLILHKDTAPTIFNKEERGHGEISPYISLLFLNSEEHGIDIPLRGTTVICDQSGYDPSCSKIYTFTPEIRDGYLVTFNDTIITHSTPSRILANTDFSRGMDVGNPEIIPPKLAKPIEEPASTHIYMLSELSLSAKVPIETTRAIIENPDRKRTFVRTHYNYYMYDKTVLMKTLPIPIGKVQLDRKPPTIRNILEIFAPSRETLESDIEQLTRKYREFYADTSMLPHVDTLINIRDISELNNILRGMQGEFGFGRSKNKKNKTKYKRKRATKKKKRRKTQKKKNKY